MDNLRLFFLGPPRIEGDGVLLSFDTRKAVALLAYLAVAGSSLTRDALAALLFPDYEPERAYANVRRTLWALNKAGLGTQLDISGELVGLRRGPGVWVDVEEFRRLISHHGSPAIPDLEAAAALYRDDFLAGLSLKDSPAFDDWQFFQAESLRGELAGVLERLSSALAATAAYVAAIAHARRWLGLDPLHEPAHRWLMRLYAMSGQRAAALRQYQECVEVLQKELGVEPEAETQALYAEVRRGPRAQSGRTAAHPPLLPDAQQQVTAVPSHNLPTPASPFVGRGRELDRIRALLADPACRLLTLLGPGGIGKTRLAIHAAGEALPAFGDGACFISLDAIGSAEMLAAGILEELRSCGAARGGGGPAAGDPRQALLRHVRDKQALLVVDRFEHVLPGAGLLSEILARAPGIKILVTSRGRLDLPEEWVFDVDGLDYPEGGAALDASATAEEATVAELQSHSAVVLFLQGALRARADYRLTREDAPHVARICRLVQGMPLGVELAASWLRVLPCSEIAEEIACSLDLLSASAGSGPERVRGLRAVFDASWEMLDPEEQQALRRLSIFHGGFGRAAAAQVAGAGLGVLASLRDKSWLRQRADGRMEIHELLRQHAGEKLDEKPRDGVEARDRHSRYFLAWLQELKPDLKGARQQGALRDIRRELNNLREAWAWAIDREDWDALADAAESVWIFCFYVSAFAEGERMLRRVAERFAAQCGGVDAAARSGDAGNARRLGRLLVRQGAFVLLTGQFGPAAELLDAGLRLARIADDRGEAAFALNWLGNHAYASGDLAGARRRHFESLELRRALGDAWSTATSLYNLGSLLGYFGEYGDARGLCEESLAMRRGLNDRVGLAFVLGDLGNIALHQGALEEARRYFTEGQAIRQEMADDIVIPHSYSRGDLSDVTYLMGNYEEAEKLARESLASLRRVGNTWNIPFALSRLALIRCARGDAAEARKLLQESLDLVGERMEPLATTHILNQLGEVLTAVGEPDAAERCHQRSLDLARAREHPPEIAAALAGLGRAAHGLHADERARQLCLGALDAYRVMGAALAVAGVNRTLGDIACASGDFELADRYLADARQVAATSGAAPLVLAIEAEIESLHRRVPILSIS